MKLTKDDVFSHLYNAFSHHPDDMDPEVQAAWSICKAALEHAERNPPMSRIVTENADNTVTVEQIPVSLFESDTKLAAPMVLLVSGGSISRETVDELKNMLENPGKSHVVLCVPPGCTLKMVPLLSAWSSDNTNTPPKDHKRVSVTVPTEEDYVWDGRGNRPD